MQLARAVTSLGGVKAYTVKGGFKKWSADQLRVKDNYNVNIGEFIKEEAEDFTSPFFVCAAFSFRALHSLVALSGIFAVLFAIFEVLLPYWVRWDLLSGWGRVTL